MNYIYLLTPFVAWFGAGGTKFLINSARARRWAFGEIGYGGIPSNHSAIVSSTTVLIALREGVQHPAFGVAITLAFIVMLDASSLRRQIGKQAGAINGILSRENSRENVSELRERLGHTPLEICAGAFFGGAVAWVVNRLDVFFIV